jgi:hypothetical protein
MRFTESPEADQIRVAKQRQGGDRASGSYRDGNRKDESFPPERGRDLAEDSSREDLPAEAK